MDRIAQIRERIAGSRDYSISEDELAERYPDDTAYLLQRVEELEKEKEELQQLLWSATGDG
jgi:hypothetical protein